MSEKEILNEKEVSRDYRFSLSKLRNDRWLRRGFPFYRVGRSIFYRKEEIEAHLAKCKVRTQD
jgi:hypothetical protein